MPRTLRSTLPPGLAPAPRPLRHSNIAAEGAASAASALTGFGTECPANRAAPSGRRRRRPSHDQFDIELDAIGHGPPVEPADEVLGGAPAHARRGDAERGQARLDVRGEFEIVEAGDRYLARHGNVRGEAFEKRPDRQNVVAADDRGRRLL